MPQMITLKKAAEATGLSYGFLRHLCLEGVIAHVRAGNKILINQERLIEYLNGAGLNEG